jgi:hypothetical protein
LTSHFPSWAEVREDETIDNVFVADGPAVIDGRVKNGVIALNGDVLAAVVIGLGAINVAAYRARSRAPVPASPAPVPPPRAETAP